MKGTVNWIMSGAMPIWASGMVLRTSIVSCYATMDGIAALGGMIGNVE